MVSAGKAFEDYHFLLLSRIEAAFRVGDHAAVERDSLEHIRAFAGLLPVLKKRLPNANHQPAYDKLTQIMEREQRFAEGMTLCKAAATATLAPLYTIRHAELELGERLLNEFLTEIDARPGVAQSELINSQPLAAREVARKTLYYAAKTGKIRRDKFKRSYKLFRATPG